jgi:hypothetical protein
MKNLELLADILLSEPEHIMIRSSHTRVRDAFGLLTAARASSDLSQQARANFLDNELSIMDTLAPQFEVIAEEQSKRLVAAHERFSALMAVLTFSGIARRWDQN